MKKQFQALYSQDLEKVILLPQENHTYSVIMTQIACDLKNLGSTHYHEKMDELIFCTNDF